MKKILGLTIGLGMLLVGSTHASFAKTANLGIHLLHPSELERAAELVKTADNADQWVYVTLPLALDDLDKRDEWQAAFHQAKKLHLQPIVRLVSRFDAERGVWAIPTRGQIIDLFNFLNSLDWPQEIKPVIIFNEPNHFAEWGGSADPASYAQVLRFAADWAHTENNHYQILPAALDLAAPSGSDTMEAFAFLDKMLEAEPEIFDKIDYWNSHSYPNPAFSAAPSATGQNSLRGFTHELDWLKQRTGLERGVFITETGWQLNSKTHPALANYYQAAAEQIWTDERIVAVTPFLLKGDPGPFSQFSMLDSDDQPTRQYSAYRAQIERTAAAFRREREAIEVADF